MVNKKKISTAEQDSYQIDTESWVTPYGNLMTFLMILFFLLYAYTFFLNDIDYERLMNRVQAQLASLDLKSSMELKKREKETEFARKLSEYVKTKGLSGAAEINISAQKIRIMFTERAVLFASGSAELDSNAINVLNDLADLIKILPETNRIIIEGHTDNVPIRTKEFANNMELSIARAISVLNYFTKKKNLPPERFAIAGYGEFRPVDMSTDITKANDTEEKRARNRRIEIIISRT
ncbi:MAG: OmpA family protein [Endomicrobia bacterium]|nr:OmpA family protein [Endomicrobiia bacterium]MCX7941017.1 OmpA family protein [Endomicrobiia bacterium]MDW8055411.1 OmpA family protein [Elusimicrobiota bacterium]